MRTVMTCTKRAIAKAIAAAFVLIASPVFWSVAEGQESSPVNDPFAWLEDIRGTRSMEWVGQQNARTLERLSGDARFQRYYQFARDALSHPSRIDRAATVNIHGEWVYRLFQDNGHPRGVWQRARIRAYLSGQASWQTLLDIDDLSARENTPWIYGGVSFHGDRSLVKLFRPTPGFQPMEVREFDLESGTIVEGGFTLPLAQQAVTWVDQDRILVLRDADESSAMRPGSLNVVRLWTRGQSYSQAREVFRSAAPGGGVTLQSFADQAGNRINIVESAAGPAGSNRPRRHWRIDSAGNIAQLAWSADVRILAISQGDLIGLRFDDVAVGESGSGRSASLVSIPINANSRDEERMIWRPGANESLYGTPEVTAAGLFVVTQNLLRGRVSRFTLTALGWQRESVEMPENGTIRLLSGAGGPEDPYVLATFQSFLHPPSLYRIDGATLRINLIQAEAPSFDAGRYVTEQFCVSARPQCARYFLVRPVDFRYDGRAPVLMTGYPGTPETPTYVGILGRLWLDNGGILVVGNHRGQLGSGSPDVRRTRQIDVYDDFISIAEDLIRRRLTSPGRIGFRGHSNGGLLVATTLNMRPELFGAAVIENPVLDLHRWGGADSPVYGSWREPEEASMRRRVSAYQNLRRRNSFPAPLITTNTDDGVFPWMARKYAARMESLSMPFFFYEGSEGGHDFGLSVHDFALHNALVYTYLAQQLIDIRGESETPTSIRHESSRPN